MISSVVTLNTKGCCLFCLKESGSLERKSSTLILPLYNLQNLSSSLKLTPETRSALQKLSKDGTNTKGSSLKTNLDIFGTFCDGCGDALKSFSTLLLKLERIQLEMDKILEGLHGRISGSYEHSDLIQNYSKRMTSDVESLRQLPVVDRLRKEIHKQSSIVRFGPQVKVKLFKLNYSYLRTMYPDLLSTDDGIIKTVEESKTASTSTAHTKATEMEPLSNINIKVECQQEEDDPPTEPNDLFFSTLPPPSPPYPPVKKESSTSSTLSGKTLSTNKEQAKFTAAVNKSLKKYKCVKCPKTFQTRYGLKLHYETIHLHLQRHHPYRRHPCNLCGRVLRSKTDLIRHKKTNCRSSTWLSYVRNPETGTYKCPLPACTLEYRNKGGALKHYRSVHLGKRYVCEKCGADFYSVAYLSTLHKERCKGVKRVKKVWEAEIPPPIEVSVKEVGSGQKRKWKCPWPSCPVQYTRSDRIREHYRVKHLGKGYKCEKCGSKFTSPSHLTRHQKLKQCNKRRGVQKKEVKLKEEKANT